MQYEMITLGSIFSYLVDFVATVVVLAAAVQDPKASGVSLEFRAGT